MKAIFAAMATAGVIITGCATNKTATQSITGRWIISNAYGVSTEGGMETAYIAFGDSGKVSGSASINHFFGSYSQDGENVKLSNIGLTQMMGAHIEIENAVVKALNNMSTISVNGDSAVVKDAKGETVMTMTREAEAQPKEVSAASIEGEWLIVSALGKTTENAADTAFLEFTNGKVSGCTGANTLNGNYNANGNALSFGEIATSRMGAGPYRETEQAVLKALETAATVTIDGDKASVADSTGATVLSLIKK